MIQSKFQKITGIFAFLIILVTQFSCTQKTTDDLSKKSIIPRPVEIAATGGSFALSAETVIYLSGDGEDLLQIGQYLADRLNPSTGFDLEVKPTKKKPVTGIYLMLSDKNSEPGNEGYGLDITEDLIQLVANKPAGLFHGVQTLRQLLPAKTELTTKQTGPWTIPTGTIKDYPEYGFRGSMLDVSRHFFDVDVIRRYIDLLAYYKMNVLHLHLSDDQGWRIEIRSWPKLTEIGGSSEVADEQGGVGKGRPGGEKRGGFYTQEQYAEIVKYAADRFITIIPEIDLPGHTNAALASYAELNCDGKARELYSGTKVGFSTLCVRKEITYEFLDDVIGELAAITPGPYIHIGGDESLVTEKEDYIYFINRVQKIVDKHGKQMIGWEEIAQAELRPNSIAQFWADDKHAKKAAEKGMKVIMSPAKKSYLDMQYDSTTRLGLHWAGYLEVDVAYNWDPETYVEGISRENILGIEAPLWSETLLNIDDIEYMMFPRLPGYAEIGWTPAALRNWNEYKLRLGNHAARFKAMGIDYYPSKLVPWPDVQID